MSNSTEMQRVREYNNCLIFQILNNLLSKLKILLRYKLLFFKNFVDPRVIRQTSLKFKCFNMFTFHYISPYVFIFNMHL